MWSSMKRQIRQRPPANVQWMLSDEWHLETMCQDESAPYQCLYPLLIFVWALGMRSFSLEKICILQNKRTLNNNNNMCFIERKWKSEGSISACTRGCATCTKIEWSCYCNAEFFAWAFGIFRSVGEAAGDGGSNCSCCWRYSWGSEGKDQIIGLAKGQDIHFYSTYYTTNDENDVERYQAF